MNGVTFYRAARRYPEPLPHEEIGIAPPPPLQQGQGGGAAAWLQLLLPLGAAMTSVVFVFAYRENLLIVAAAGGTALLSVVIGVIMRVSQVRGARKQREVTRSKYLAYLDRQGAALQALAQRQQAVNDRLYPSVADLATALAEKPTEKELLWERRLYDEDFLTVRIGSGPAPLDSRPRLDMPNNPFAEYDQELLGRAQALINKYEHLERAPIAAPLRAAGVVSLRGAPDQTRMLARSIVTQIATMSSPEDVRIFACFPPAAADQWNWLKWLPHTRRLRQSRIERGKPEPLCLLATSTDDARELLLAQIAPELERRRKLSDERTLGSAPAPMKPHLVFVLDSFSLGASIAQLATIDELLREASALGATVICLVDERSDEPPSVRARISNRGTGWLTFEETILGGRRRDGVVPDEVSLAECERIARALAPLALGEKGAQQDLSQDVRLLDLLRVPSADAYDIRQEWTPRAKQHLLRVPIGMRADGEPLMLDVKEAAEGGMGPHGLIIGATGSGKSELLRSIVTSLAMCHDPETLNFVLADFKGGASFADLAALPHTAGMITNLQSDLSLVDRMRASLAGEQERRQRMLREGGNLDNIRQYHAKRQQNPSMEPMPYLMIIVDEFAELLANRPDFLELFVAIGRVGRSLGMHLLLATQRLGEGRISGLEGHLRYRFCLRTFSAAESSAVLGTNDAYYLSSFPGVGYFKVDTTVYDLFKSAIISAPYSANTQNAQATLIRAFTPTGALATWTPPSAQAAERGATAVAVANPDADTLRTEMDVIIERLAEQERELRPPSAFPVHQVWLPPLSVAFPLQQALDQGGVGRLDGGAWPAKPPFGPVVTPIGLIDRPSEQAQEPFYLDFSGARGHLALVGSPQSGKSTMLQTLVTSFLVTHSPRDVQIYCIDLGGGLLRVFEGAPHVGAVCGKSDRDKIRRLIRQMRSVIEERELLFRERGIDTMATFRAMRQAGELNETPFGDVFLLIDDLAQLLSEGDPQLEAELVDLLTTGLTYGVHVVIATNRWADIRPKLRDPIGARLELRLNDPADSEMGKAVAQSIPPGTPGRGVIKGGQQFQVALPYVGGVEVGDSARTQRALEALVTRAASAWRGPVAPPVRLLPPRVTWGDLRAHTHGEPSGIPIGLEEFQLETVYLDFLATEPHLIVLGDGESGKTNLIRTMLRGIEQRYTPEQARFVVVDYRRMLLDMAESTHLMSYALSAPMLKTSVEELKTELDKRVLNTTNFSLAELRNPRKWEGPHYFLFADDYDAIVTPMGNPLAPLAELLLQGRDVGFHLVIARRVGGTSRSAFEPIFQRLKEMASPGIILSGDPGEGALLGQQRATQLPPGRGYLVRRNHRTALVQVAYTEPETAL